MVSLSIVCCRIVYLLSHWSLTFSTSYISLIYKPSHSKSQDWMNWLGIFILYKRRWWKRWKSKDRVVLQWLIIDFWIMITFVHIFLGIYIITSIHMCLFSCSHWSITCISSNSNIHNFEVEISFLLYIKDFFSSLYQHFIIEQN